jgi:hypothetical protein
MREPERRKWHQRQMRQRLRSTVKAPVTGMKHPDIDNSVHSVKYPIRDLLRWLEKVEADDKVKYGFLKYIYTSSQCDTSQVQLCHADNRNQMHAERNAIERCRKSDVNRRDHAMWEPLLYDSDESDESS